MEFRISRIKIFLYWLLISVVVSLVSSIISMLYWNYTYIPEPNIDWRPIDDFFGMLKILPFGFLLSVAMPWGWASIVGLIIASWLKDSRPLLVSILSALVFGWYWPKWFVALMGV